VNDQDDPKHPRRADVGASGGRSLDPASLPKLPKMGRLVPGQRPKRPPRPRRRAPGQIAPADVPVLLAEAARGGPPDLTDPRVVRRILRQHGLRPNKDFGQHLLADRVALEAIVDAAELEPSDAVLEVGAGMGVLTEALAERVGRIVAVELDRGILPVLRETVARFEHVEIIPRNLLEVDPAVVFGKTPYKLVANLPYYITAPTLRHFLERTARPTRLVVMVQREVAERMVAGPGDLSLLGVSVQFYGTPRLIRVVPAASFYPPPQVDSAIVRVDVFPEPPLDAATRELMFSLAHAGFAEKRKQLHNTLASHLSAPRETINRWLELAAIDPKRRAETLSVDDWVRLTRAAQAQPR
jgi:16S rRNA (adenine1518-N6/adenine1519-N6)-dimethyltransferase